LSVREAGTSISRGSAFSRCSPINKYLVVVVVVEVVRALSPPLRGTQWHPGQREREHTGIGCFRVTLACVVYRDPLLHSERTQGFAADPDYWKGEVFAYVGLPQNLKDLKGYTLQTPRPEAKRSTQSQT